jgi:hypothetical protein
LPLLVPEQISIHNKSNYNKADNTDKPRGHPSTPQLLDPEKHEHEDDDKLLLCASTQSIVEDIETSPKVLKPSHIPPSLSSAIIPPRHFSNNSHIFPNPLHYHHLVNLSSPLQM